MNVVLAELGKLRRYGIVKAGCLVTVLAALYGFAPALARDGVRKTFPLVMNNLLESNCIYFFPAMIVLIGGCMARREYTDDTLKNILTVPLSLRRLLLGKIIVLFFMTVGFSVLSFLLGTALCFVMELPDATLPILAEWLVRIVAGNLLVFVAVLPLTLLASLFVDGVYACTAAAFVYGFFASMEAAILNYYPAKAVLILVDPRCGVGYDFVHYSSASAVLTLLVVLQGSAVLFALLNPPQTLRKIKSPKRAARAKGW